MEKTTKVFVCILEYEVKVDHKEEFEKFYGPKGGWEQLFLKSDGYIGTDLYQDFSNKKRYMTIDFWITKKDWEHFMAQYAKAYELLDANCERFTEQEKSVGSFTSILTRFYDQKNKA